MVFDQAQLDQLTEHFSRIGSEYITLASAILTYPFNEESARNYASHGFLRRMNTLKRCIENIYEIFPPEQTSRMTFEESQDVTINIQAFTLNTYGCLDNLAWIWVKERNIKYKSKSSIKLTNEEILSQFSPPFRFFIKSIKEWVSHVENFRHALAHRIPLYTPPFSMTDEEHKRHQQITASIQDSIKDNDFTKLNNLYKELDSIGNALPLMVHSFEENSPYVFFHAQVLADWNTLIELSKLFIIELNNGCTPT